MLAFLERKFSSILAVPYAHKGINQNYLHKKTDFTSMIVVNKKKKNIEKKKERSKHLAITFCLTEISKWDFIFSLIVIVFFGN